MQESQLKMLVVHAKYQHGGFYLALVPAALAPAEIDAALHELGIDAATTREINDWRTTSENVAVAYLPFPGEN